METPNVNGYRVTTESGTVYELDFGTGFYTRGGQFYGKLGGIRNVDWDEMRRESDNLDYGYSVIPFEWLNELPVSFEPEVGKGMYITNMDGWSISTPVQTIEVVDA